MEWINVKTELPIESGKYIVKTITTMGNIHKLECYCSITDNKPKFNVSNQIVTHWLKEN